MATLSRFLLLTSAVFFSLSSFSAETVKIGLLNLDQGPYSKSSDGHIVGVIPDMLSDYAVRMDRSIELVTYTSEEEMKAALFKNELTGFVTSDIDKKELSLSYSHSIISSRKIGLSQDNIRYHHQLDSKHLAYIKGLNNKEFLQMLYPDSTLLSTTSVKEAVHSVAMEQVDAMIGDGILLYDYLRSSPYADFLSISLFDDLPVQGHFIAFNVDNSDELSLFNRTIIEHKQAGGSREIIKKWLDETQERLLLVHSTGLALTEDEQAWIKHNPKVLIVTKGDSPPIDFYSDENGHEGIAADILKAIAKVTKIELSVINEQQLAEKNKGMIHNSAIPLIHASATYKKTTDTEHLFSQPYMVEPWAIIGRNQDFSNELLMSVTQASAIGTVEDTVGVDLISGYCSECSVITYASNEALLQGLDKEEIDSVMMSLYLASPMLQTTYAGRLRVVSLMNQSSEVPISFSVEPDHQLLLNIINKALNTIPANDFQKIKKKWRNVSYESGIDIKDVVVGVALILSITSVVILCFMAWSWKLKKEVESRKKVEKELQHRIDFERSLLDAMPFPIIVRDSEGVTLSVNRAANELVDFTTVKNEIVDNPEEDNKVIKGSIIPRAEREVVLSDEKKHYAYWKCPYGISNSNAGGSVTILDDVTELHLARVRAKNAERKIQKLADNVSGAVVQHTQPKQQLNETHFTFISAGIVDLIGLTSQEIMSDHDSFFAPINSKDRDVLVKKVLVAGKKGSLSQDIAVTVNGNEKWLHLQSKISESDDYYTWDTVITDITALKQQQEDLKEARQKAIAATEAKSTFLANMSHEIRTPIGGIVSLLELCHKYDTSDEVDKIHTSLSQSANNLLHIVNDILDFSKIEAGKLSLSLQECSLENLVIRITQLQARHAHAKGLKFQLWLDPNIAETVLIDDVRLGQVLNNLLNNAIKFTEFGVVGLHITLVETDEDQQTILFKVMDNGIGIEKEKLKGLFQAFVQADEGTTRKFGGSGLGLSISKQLITQMGGDIAVSSQIGEGSEFKILLPVTMVKAQLDVDKSPQKALIINNFFQKKELITYLSHWGIECISVETHNAEKLDFFISKHQVDLLFLSEDDYGKLYEPRSEAYELPYCFVLNQFGMLSPVPKSNHWQMSSNPIIPSQLKYCLDNEPNKHMAIRYVKDVNQETFTQTRQEAEASGRLILVAEDHPINQQVIKSQLEQLGFHGDIVENGQEALSALEKHHYGLLITDCHMPEVDGYELTQMIRLKEKQQDLAPLPIIALTANAIQGEKDKCLEFGMDDFLSKPTKLSVMEETILKYLMNESQTHEIKSSTAIDLKKSEAGTGAMGASLIDKSKITEIFGDELMAEQVISDFIESHHTDFAHLSQAYHHSQLDELKLIAHRMKGAARMLECTLISEVLEQFELAVDNADKDQYQDYYAKLDALTQQLMEVN